jgi:3-dehydroquinate synthase
LNRIVGFLMEVFPVYSFGEGIYDELISLMLKDKKNSNGQIGFALLAEIGRCDVDHFLQEDAIRKGLDFYRTAVELHKPADQ